MRNRVLHQPFLDRSAKAKREYEAARRKVGYVRLRRSMYATPAWRALRAEQLRGHPRCQAYGCKALATVVDHVRGHRGAASLFYDPDNLQSLCVTHHNRKTGRYEGGFSRASRDAQAIESKHDDDDEPFIV